ncbi:MAG: hypothetical protein ACLVJO_09800 [[Clostridium] scindens]
MGRGTYSSPAWYPQIGETRNLLNYYPDVLPEEWVDIWSLPIDLPEMFPDGRRRRRATGTADIRSDASGTSCAVSSGIGSGTGRNERQYGNELELLDVPAGLNNIPAAGDAGGAGWYWND